MALLLRPQLLLGEGPYGYLLRLAEANDLSLRDLADLGISFQAGVLHRWGCLNNHAQSDSVRSYVHAIDQAMHDYRRIWNTVTARYCPRCLSETGHWHVGWELLFVDACTKHECWLVDSCPDCRTPVTWTRHSLLNCDCGTPLSSAQSQDCPDALIMLARAMANKVLEKRADIPIGVAKSLNAAQIHRLVKLLGAYGDLNAGPKPQKMAHLDRMNVSWRVTSIAAEILNNWPSAFHHILHQMQARKRSDGRFRLSSWFGHFYFLIQRGFREPEFAFLRQEFENFIADHWRGSTGRRKQFMSPGVLDRLAWIPANHACARLGLSRRRLLDLILQGRITGEERIGLSGRKSWVIRREDVEHEFAKRSDEIDLVSASVLLGFTRKRMAAIAARVIPEARRTGERGCPWSIPRGKLDKLLGIAIGLERVDTVGQDEVNLLHVLRYWPWSDAAIADLLLAILAQSIFPFACWSQIATGITGMLFRRGDLVDWHNRSQHRRLTSLSIPEVAERLEIKQEVAYALVRKGLLRADTVNLNRRAASRLSMASLSHFQQTYVFGRDLAEEIGTSPRALAEGLGKLNVFPVSGPGVDGCRQLLFVRNDALNIAIDLFRFSKKRRRSIKRQAAR